MVNVGRSILTLTILQSISLRVNLEFGERERETLDDDGIFVQFQISRKKAKSNQLLKVKLSPAPAWILLL